MDSLPSVARPTTVRRRILALTVALYVITYVDRVVMSTAVPSIQREFGFSLVAIGWIFSGFQITYALFQIPSAWFGDRVGARRGLGAVVLWWSLFTAATAATWSAPSMFICRVLFGIGEAGAYPIGTQALSRWTLLTERGWTQGLTHAGSRLGGAVTPVLVAFLIARLGWRAPFVIFAMLGIVWAVAWFWYYRESPLEHSGVNDAERELIAAGQSPLLRGSERLQWDKLLRHPQIWLLSLMYFCYSYCIGIFLTWFPKYLADARHYDLAAMGLFATLPLMAGVTGDMLGGWLSDLWLRYSGDVNKARRGVAVAGFLAAGAAIPVAALTPHPEFSVACFCAAVFCLELTVGVSWAVTMDMGGTHSASVSATMNTLGNFGTAVAGVLTGYVVTQVGWNVALFIPSGLALVAACLFSRLTPARRLVLDAQRGIALP